MFNSLGVDLDLDSSFIHPIPKAQTVWQGTSHLKRALNGTPSLPKPSEPHVKELDVLMRYASAGRTWAPYWYIQLMHVAPFWWCDWPSRDGLPHFVLLSVPYVARATKHPEYAVASTKNSYTTLLLPYIIYWNYLGSVMHLQTYYKKPWRNHGTLYLTVKNIFILFYIVHSIRTLQLTTNMVSLCTKKGGNKRPKWPSTVVDQPNHELKH